MLSSFIPAPEETNSGARSFGPPRLVVAWSGMRKRSMFKQVPKQPDFPQLEREVLRFWGEKDVFAKLRAKLIGGPRWSFLDGPITANNPMGVHHAWGRSYK